MSKINRFLTGSALIVLAAMLTAACDLNLGDSTTINTATATTGPSAGASPSTTGGGCEAAASGGASVLGGSDIKAGSIEKLDATFRTANGREITGQCAQAKQPAWSAFAPGEPCEFTTSPSGYNPSVRGNAPGSCSTTATLDGASAPLTFRVNP